MRFVKTIGKKTLFWILPFLLLSSTLTLLLPNKAFAEDEIYEWASNTSINIRGGDLQASGVLSTQSPNSNSLAGRLVHESGCNFRLQILMVAGGNNALGSLFANESSAGGTPIPNSCPQNIRDTYNGDRVTIQGVRPGPGDLAETQDQKYVSATLNSPQRNGEAPINVTFTVKNAAGQTVDEKVATRTVFDDNADVSKRSVIYSSGFYLEGSPAPGTPYTMCYSAYITTCTPFNKIKYQSIILPAVGEISSGRTIAAHIQGSVQMPAGEGFTVAPIEVTLEKSDGTGLITQHTTVYNYPSCDHQVPGQAPDDIECAARGTGVTIPISPLLNALFDGVDAGTYKVCVPVLNQCQDVTKVAGRSLIVDFNITSSQMQGLASGALGDEESPRCETNGNPLTWILCPVFNGLTGFADWVLEDILQPLLKSDPVDLDPNSNIYKIWSAFRVYGNIILLIALLVTVFGQIIGGGVVEAYTARRMLPRILLAAVLINLSIYIVALAIDISNVIGFAIADLIITPVQSSAEFTFTPDGPQSVTAALAGGAGIFTLFFAGFFAPGVLGAAALFILLFVVLPAVLALLGIFITIILLHALIFALIILSPVAFALYCLPNTEQYFKTWWNWLFRALLVYPIVMIIFAIADVMTVAILQAN